MSYSAHFKKKLAEFAIMNIQVVFCSCGYGTVIPEGKKAAVLGWLKARAPGLLLAEDLCRACAGRNEGMLRLLAAAEIAVVACHPRAVRWLLEAAGLGSDGRKIHFFDLRRNSEQEIMAGLQPLLSGEERQGEFEPARIPPLAEGDWISWFPVIDYGRCTACGQCLDFCLFSVYSRRDDGTVAVSSPRNCKTNCPACSRVCPSTAIIFPKHSEPPANGDEVTPANENKGDVSALGKMTREEIYAKLYGRRGK